LYASKSNREGYAMPANKGGDSKQGLIIALISFILLTITLGVFTYMGYAQAGQEEKKTAEEKVKTSAAEKLKDWYKFEALQMRSYIGKLNSKDDQTAFDGARGQYDSNSLSPPQERDAEFKTLAKALDESRKFDSKQKKALKSYEDEVGQLTTDWKNAKAAQMNAEDLLAKEKARSKEDLAAANAQAESWHKKFDDALKTNQADKDRLTKEFEDKLKDLNGVSQKLQTVTTTGDDAVRERDKLIAQLNKKVAALELQLHKLREKMTPPDLMKYDTPKGKIVRLDPTGEMAWIDLGSEDNVDPHQNLTFSIFGAENAGRASSRKGAIEVVDVAGPHLARARITEVVDPGRYPLMEGDLLINPVWNSNNHMHVAIAGYIDLGDGRDGIEEFMRNLQKQGVIIDAYLDLKDLSVKGDGKMTMKTDYLIVGEIPEFKTAQDIKNMESRGAEKKMSVTDKISAMRKEANELGVTTVPLQKFVALNGYHLPRGTRLGQGLGYDSVFSPTSDAERRGKEKEKDAPKKDKKAAKEDKKDDEEKDK
jgi:hypothetical protein